MMTRRLAALALVLSLCSCASAPKVAPLEMTGTVTVTGLGSADLGPVAADSVLLRGPLAFVGCGAAGVRVVDISDPAVPEVIAILDTVAADAIAVAGDTLYVASRPSPWIPGADGDLTCFDLIDPRAPEVSVPAGRDLAGGVDVSAEGGWIGLAAEGAGLSLLNARTFAAVDLTSKWEATTTLAVLIRRGLLIAYGRIEPFDFGLGYGKDRDVLRVLKIAGAEVLATRELPAGGDRPDLALCGDLLLVADRAGVAGFDLGGTLAAVPLVPLTGATGVDGGLTMGAVASGDVHVLDLADPQHPAVACRIATPGEARDVALQGDLLAVADGRAGLRLYRLERAAGGPSE